MVKNYRYFLGLALFFVRNKVDFLDDGEMVLKSLKEEIE
jgi:hypothetical protein